MKSLQFDYAVGNPPYQSEIDGTAINKPPIYNLFMDNTYSKADTVLLLTPARFLFNTGKTAREWNEKMLHDRHLQVKEYFAKSSVVFPDAKIGGGLVVTCHDMTKDYGEIGVFVVYPELNSIRRKVWSIAEQSLRSVVYSSESYKFSQGFHVDYPQAKGCLSAGHAYDLCSNVFDRLDFAFHRKEVKGYVKILGRADNKRLWAWIKPEYLRTPDNFAFYKVFFPKIYAPVIGGVPTYLLGPLAVAEPFSGHTQTFASIGRFESFTEAEACMKYIKTRFARAMLGVLKVTQFTPTDAWEYVPMQDFTDASDINWSAVVAEIDRQLYRKYGLTQGEIAFIEEHLKELG